MGDGRVRQSEGDKMLLIDNYSSVSDNISAIQEERGSKSSALDQRDSVLSRQRSPKGLGGFAGNNPHITLPQKSLGSASYRKDPKGSPQQNKKIQFA